MSIGHPEPAAREGGTALLERVAQALPELRASERAVAHYVLEHPGKVIHQSFRQIAQLAGVSEPTIARFCTALGYSGYREFKLRLAQSLASGVPFVHSDVDPGDTMEEIRTKVFDRAASTLLAVRNHLDPRTVQAAVDLLARASRIEFYGQGNSGIVAQDAENKFFRLGVATRSCSDPNVHAMSASLLGPDAVVVAISASGSTRDILRSVEIARETGAGTIGVTVGGSPLARACNLALTADVPEDFHLYAPMTSRIAHLTILDLLSVGVAIARGPALTPRLLRAKEVVAERRTPID